MTILALGSAMYISRSEGARLRYDQVVAGASSNGQLSQRLGCGGPGGGRKSIRGSCTTKWAETLNALLVDAGNLQKRIPEAIHKAGNC
jgi:hypothetical protein